VAGRSPEGRSVEPRETPDLEPFLPVRLGVVTAGLLSVLLYLSLLGLPLLGVFVAPMAAVPVIQVRAGGRPPVLAWGWPALLLATVAVVGGATALGVLVGYLLLVAWPATTAEWWSEGGWTEGRWVAVTTALGLVLVLALAAALSGGDPVGATRALIHRAGLQAEPMYLDLGFGRGEIALMLDRAERTLGWVLPGMLTGYLVMTLFWLRPRLPFVGLPVEVGPFEQYRNDEWLPAAFAAAGAGTVLLHGVPRWVAVNALMVVLILCFVQGLAIIRAHVARFVGRGLLVRWGLGLICLQVPLVFLVAALGMIDSFRSLRPAAVTDDGRNE